VFLEMKIPGRPDSIFLLFFEPVGFQANHFAKPVDAGLYSHFDGHSGPERSPRFAKQEFPVSHQRFESKFKRHAFPVAKRCGLTKRPHKAPSQGIGREPEA
jgi:hypothetical protein